MRRTLEKSLLVLVIAFGSGSTAGAITAPGAKEEPGRDAPRVAEAPVIPEEIAPEPLPVPNGFSIGKAMLPDQALAPIGPLDDMRFEEPLHEMVAAPVPGSALFLLTAMAGLVIIHRRHVRAAGEAVR